MLTTNDIRTHLSKVTYKPGWEFEIYDGRWEGQHLVIRTRVEDSYNPGHMTTLDVHSMLPPMRDVEALNEWLAWRLGRIELHEMREFFKVEGKVVFNPHGTDADRDLGLGKVEYAFDE